MAETILTLEGKKELERRLEQLKVEGRQDIAEKIKKAREFGDISENAEYDAAKDEQAQMESEIENLEQQLRNAVIIEESSIDRSSVSVGCTVKLKDISAGETVEYKIVGTTESDPSLSRISNESPVGAALLGKKKNDTVSVKTPGGMLDFKILGIS